MKNVGFAFYYMIHGHSCAIEQQAKLISQLPTYFQLNKDLAACNILAKNNFFSFHVANNIVRLSYTPIW